MSTYEIAPALGRPRSSEGSFCPLRDGRILFCYSAFRGESARDYACADIAAIESADGGATWSEPRVLLTADDHGAMNVMSVSLLRMARGDIGLFYLVRKTWDDMRVVLRRSADEGATWGEASFATPRKGYFVLNNDRAVRLSTGRILLPVAEHVVLEDRKPVPKYSPAATGFFYSDDDGESWRESPARLDLSGTRSRSGMQEPGVIERADGTLYGWARTDLFAQYEFTSTDGGLAWSPAVPSRFSSPLSPLSMKRLCDGRLLALWNPIPEYVTRNSDRRTGGRTPLVCALSEDEGAAWGGMRRIEDNPEGGYCYTAILPLADRVLLAYCGGDTRRDTSCLNRLIIRVLPMDAIGLPRGADGAPHAMGIGF